MRFKLELALGLLVTLLFADYLFSSDLLYGSDSIPSGIFFRGIVVDFVKAHGELPKWNPYILGGLPFLDATHGDTFFPTSILQYVFPVYRALGHKLVLHIFLAGVFMAFYLRSLRLHPHAVVFGAVSYMLSPVFVSYIYAGQDGKMYVTSLAPLVLGLLERAMRSGRLATFLGLGLAIGFTILSAQIQMAYHCLWFVGALFCVRWILGAHGEERRPSRAERIRRLGFFGVAVTIGVLLASIQLFPAVAYVKHPQGFSVRSERTSYEHASSWSLHPEEVASMIVPEFCNSPSGYWGRNFFKYNSDYVGILTLVLAALALARRRDATRWFLGGLAGFCVAYSLGAWTPIHKLFYWIVPQVKLFRAPPLVMFGAAFGLAALAAHAVHDLQTRGGKNKAAVARLLVRIGGGAAAVIAIAGLAAGTTTSVWTTLFSTPLPPPKAEALQGNLDAYRTGALIAAAILALGVGAITARLRGKLGARPVIVILVLLAIVDLCRIDYRFKLVMEPSRWITAQGFVARLSQESEREKFRVMPVRPGFTRNELGYFGIESTMGFHDNELAWYREMRDDPVAQQLLATNASGYPLLRILNVKYLLHDSPDYPNPLPIPNYLPRFRVADEWDIVPDRTAALARLLSDDHDPARTVLLEEDPGLGAVSSGEGPAGRVVDYEYDGNEIRCTVEASRPCLLVHAENWFPYWHAWEGDRELPILRADGVIRAIPITAGRHEIRFDFESRPYEIGKWVTASVLLLTLAGIGLGLRRHVPAA